MPIIKIHNVQTNEVVEREMTETELLDWEKLQKKNVAEAKAEAQKVAEKAALLERLGITEDEARLLLG
jgi:predicted Ser/Thr protein kinase